MPLLRSRRLLGAFVISPLLSMLLERLQTIGSLRSADVAPLHRYYCPPPPPLPASPPSRWRRLYVFSFSADFSTGRGGLLHLLGFSLSSCCPFPPASLFRRPSQSATIHA